MALDAKTIKEEIPDKETYESTTNTRKPKGKEHSKTPDSPEGARAVAPHSPISPSSQVSHHSSLAPPRSHRNGSVSPIVNGNTSDTKTPPPPSSITGSTLPPHGLHSQADSVRALMKIRRFLGALVQFGQDTCHDNGDKVRALVLSMASGSLSTEEFKTALQEATNFPVRQNVLPFLRSHIPLLQREVISLARSSNQTPLQYVRSNENCVIEFSHNPTETTDIFLPIDGGSLVGGNHTPSINGGSQNYLKRRASDFMENYNGQHEWSDLLPPKRPAYAPMVLGAAPPHIYAGHPTQFLDYQSSSHSNTESIRSDQRDGPRDDRDVRSLSTDPYRSRGSGGGGGVGNTERNAPATSGGDSEEWKSIHTMLSCVSAMVEKTKRAITILQQRSSSDTPVNYTADTALAEMKRQTEEKVAEFRRNAEEAVNQVKRQAVIEIQRAVATAENRAVEIMAQERLKMDKFFSELHKPTSESVDGNSQSPVVPGSGAQNICWNCGRKGNETCSGCNVARYCGAFCQHKDWEQHHQVCVATRIESANSKQSQIPKAPIRSSPPQQTTPQPTTQQAPATNGVSLGIK